MTIEEENNKAIEHGFKPIPCDYRGHGWCYFEKGNASVWICAPYVNGERKIQWASALLIGDKYSSHKYFDNLEDALSRNFN